MGSEDDPHVLRRARRPRGTGGTPRHRGRGSSTGWFPDRSRRFASADGGETPASPPSPTPSRCRPRPSAPTRRRPTRDRPAGRRPGDADRCPALVGGVDDERDELAAGWCSRNSRRGPLHARVLGNNCAREHCGEHYRRGDCRWSILHMTHHRNGADHADRAQWNDYSRDGYLHLGKVLEPDGGERALRSGPTTSRSADRRTGTCRCSSTPAASTRSCRRPCHAFDQGHDRSTARSRGSRADDLFAALVRHPLSSRVCARQYGAHAAVSIFRAMVMNKPAGQGTDLPVAPGRRRRLGARPRPAGHRLGGPRPGDAANGCVEVIPGTHRLGLLSLYGSTVARRGRERHCPAGARPCRSRSRRGTPSCSTTG